MCVQTTYFALRWNCSRIITCGRDYFKINYQSAHVKVLQPQCQWSIHILPQPRSRKKPGYKVGFISTCSYKRTVSWLLIFISAYFVFWSKIAIWEYFFYNLKWDNRAKLLSFSEQRFAYGATDGKCIPNPNLIYSFVKLIDNSSRKHKRNYDRGGVCISNTESWWFT